MSGQIQYDTQGMLQPLQIVVKHRACSRCHKAKTACDGLQPCGRCIRLGDTIASQCTAHKLKHELIAEQRASGVNGRSSRRVGSSADRSSSSSSSGSQSAEVHIKEVQVPTEVVSQSHESMEVALQYSRHQQSLHQQHQKSHEEAMEQIRLIQLQRRQLEQEQIRTQQQHTQAQDHQGQTQSPHHTSFSQAHSVQHTQIDSASPADASMGALHLPHGFGSSRYSIHGESPSVAFQPAVTFLHMELDRRSSIGMSSVGGETLRKAINQIPNASGVLQTQGLSSNSSVGILGAYGMRSLPSVNRSISGGDLIFGTGNTVCGGFEEIQTPSAAQVHPSSFLNSLPPNSPTRSIHVNIGTAVPAAAPAAVPAAPTAAVVQPVSKTIIAPPGGWSQSNEDEELVSRVREVVPPDASPSVPPADPSRTGTSASQAEKDEKDDNTSSTGASSGEPKHLVEYPGEKGLDGWNKVHEAGPVGLSKKSFELLKTNRVYSRLQLLLDRRQVTARLIQFVCAQRSEGLLESDFKELAKFSPVPIVASTKADFAHRKSFLEWQQQNLATIYAKASLPSGGGGDSSFPTISGPTDSIPHLSHPFLHSGHPCGSKMLHDDARLSSYLLPFDFDFTDSPLLCVEDELSAAGEFTLSDYLMHAQDPEIATIMVRTSRSQEWKHGRVTESTSRSSSNKADEVKMEVDSGCGSGGRSSRKRRSRSRTRRRESSRFRSRSTSRQESERGSETSRAQLAESRRKRQKTHDSSSDHRRATYSDSPPRDSKSLALSLDRRRKAFGSYQQPSQYDLVTTDHDSRCPHHSHSAKVTSQFQENTGVRGETTDEKDQQPQCNCPQVVKRRMFIQVNRAWERLFGYSQKEVREIVIKEGWGRMNTRFIPRTSDSSELGWFEFMLTSDCDFHFVAPVHTKWNTHIPCMSQVHVIRADDGDLDGVMHKFTPAPGLQAR